MNGERAPRDYPSPLAPPNQRPLLDAVPLDETRALERAVDHVLDDCFFAVGQAIGMRTTVEYDAIVWWRDHFRPRFLAALGRMGERWIQDRQAVTAVGWMLAERAVRYAADKPAIDVEAARQASADVERYCQLHSRRRARAAARTPSDQTTRIAGYWCTPPPID